jgi:Transposase
MTVILFPGRKDTSTAESLPQPKVAHITRSNARRRAPCPHCGKLAKRHGYHHRTVRGIAHHAIVYIHITTAEYKATCDCCTTFHSQIDGIEPRARYSNEVRDAVLNRLFEDHMTVETIKASLQRDFYLDLSDGFMYDCIDWKIRQVNVPAYRQWTLEHFSGTLCIDELHLGRRTLLLATDPINDFPVAFALVSRNDQDHMERFLNNLAQHGFRPQVVVTDGSSLYPKLLAAIWPDAKHQLCIFHVIKDINECVLDAVRQVRRRLQAQGRKGPRRKRGRPKRSEQRRCRQESRRREKASYIFKHRFVLTKRPEHLTFAEHKVLRTLLAYAPSLRSVRAFVEEVHELFADKQTPEQARARLMQLRQKPEYQADPNLARALAILEPAQFEKMITFLHMPLGQRVRTNNHVERSNRRLRYYEKVRYRWRRRQTIVRFVVLLISRQWEERLAEPPQEPDQDSDPPAIPIRRISQAATLRNRLVA